MSGPVAHAEDEEKTSDPTVEEGHASVESQIFSERNELSVVTDGDGAIKSIELGSHEGARKSIELGAHEGARKSIELGSHEGARKSVELGAHEAPRKSIELGAHKIGEKLLPNGDLYVGSFRGSLPHGSGKYLWADGCMYEGDWGRGKKCGRGRMSWPSGATYEGDFQGGYIQGVGTFVGMDGLTYKGDWSLNEKHGLGRKRYSNGDVYEGSWNHGVPEGPGRYVWQIGNVYMGDWRGGKMSGRGVMTWASGDSFDGNWLNGMAHGFGFYTWADGSCYIGTWSKGLKDGKGTFYPAGSKGPPLRRLHHGSMSVEDQMVNLVHQNVNHDSARLSHSYSLNLGRFSFRRHRSSGSSERLLTDEYLKSSENTPSRNVALQRRWSLEGAMENVLGQDKPWNADQPVIDEETEMNDVSVPVLEREYMQGVLISELVKDDSFSLSKISRRRQRKQAKEIKKPGETIIKGHRSYDLMLNLQLGIRYTVGKITPIPRREVRSSDFGPRARIWMKFPRGGSQLTPPHQSVDFKWKDYCPMVFRNLREMFKIDAADYMMSICGSAALRELSSPGKSGSVFYLSQDDRFMIKTLRKSEVQVLLRMLPSYHHHVHMHENTLITKFFGLHRIKPAGGQKVRFVVMGNMFCTELRIHRRFDLKGSSQGRSTDKFEIDVNTTLKDLDLDYVFRLEPSWREALLKQIELDCRFLESQQIMDYSLLLGLHFRAPQYLKSYLSGCHNASVSTSIEEDMTNYPQGLVLVARDPDQDGVILGSHVRGTPLRASAVDDKEVDLLLPGTARLRVQLGVNMPARADHKPRKDKDQSSVQLFDEAYDVVLYLGIIDILQEYNLAKKIEHAYKSFQFDSTSISAVEPKLYSQRFLDFIQKVFPANSNSIEAES